MVTSESIKTRTRISYNILLCSVVPLLSRNKLQARLDASDPQKCVVVYQQECSTKQSVPHWVHGCFSTEGTAKPSQSIET